MVNAGRILIMAKGAWSNLTNYEMLDLVTDDGVAYIARQASVGVRPKNDTSMTYWQTFGSAVTPDGSTIIYDANNQVAVNLDNETLKYDGTATTVKVSLDNVTLKYDSANGYIYADVASSISGLTDTNITNLTNGQILQYDSTTQKWKNVNPSAGGGSTINITTLETTLRNKNVILTISGQTYTTTFNSSGTAKIEGIKETGTATLTSSDGTDTATYTLEIPYYGSYSAEMSFFSATINVTFPYSSGATCTCSKGGTTLTATNSPYTFNVYSSGTWRITVTLDGISKYEDVNITSSGQTVSKTIEFGTINLTFDNEFRGQTITATDGTSTITKTAPMSGNTMVLYPNATGNWTVSGVYSGTTYVSNPNPVSVSSLSTPVSATLQTMVTINVTLHGANTDSITFTDASGVSKTEIFESGETSKSVSMKVLPSGSSITFTSAVAKNPTNLSSDYSKIVTVTSATTDIYVMPDNALYWYGYITEHLEYTFNTSPLVSTLTFNTNSVTMYGNNTSQTNMAYAALIFNKPITSETTLKCYVSGHGINKNFGTDNNYAITSSSYLVDNSSPITIDAVSQHSLASQSGKYPAISCGGGTYYLHAIWAE